jgi:hypothetical protein
VVSFKRLSMIFILLTIVNFIGLGDVFVQAATKVPNLQIVTQPNGEYKEGETVSFTVSSPNYGGQVQYRVILWNGTTKKSFDLWKSKSIQASAFLD